MQRKSILVLGATGGLGGAVAATFLAHGWRVRALTRHRNPVVGLPPDLAGIEWVNGDAMNPADVCRAARDASGQAVDCIFHGLNPPNYQRWRELALPMLAHSVEAARQTGARLLFPGNVYNYGPDAGVWLDEAASQHPLTRKGQVRVEMEAMLQAGGQEGLRAIVVRAGDFFGRSGPSTWFSRVMVKPGRPVRKVLLPAEPQMGHAWAYLPDLAETFYQLALREAQLPAFDTFHFGGHWTPASIELVESIRRVTGREHIRAARAPWRLIAWLSPWVGLMREIQEMRYLWRTPMRLNNRKLVQLLGHEPHTPLDDAIRQALVDQGCLPASTDPQPDQFRDERPLLR
ncbi:MAG: sugar nucleotide-binding protein [Burkholderiales bacterium]|nr:sugar nucleotide-binding protein [Burkholderiales bacterium]